MDDLIHHWDYQGERITFTWLGQVDIRPDRVYAIAFELDQKIVLVTDENWFPKYWLPGGGIEPGESPIEALIRELSEEANATIQDMQMIGIQRADSLHGACTHQAFYWCRVILEAEFTPQYEVTRRILVRPGEFLDRLFWGRKDPKAPMLLELAMQINQSIS